MRVLFFAQVKDAAGCGEAEVPLAAPVSAEQVWSVLVKQFPALARHRAHTRLARNGEYASVGTLFANEDEVALIPPVSGG